MCKSDVIMRAMQTVDALRSRPHTAQELGDVLGVTKQAAGRYITAASLLYPVQEQPRPSDRRGGKPLEYWIEP